MNKLINFDLEKINAERERRRNLLDKQLLINLGIEFDASEEPLIISENQIKKIRKEIEKLTTMIGDEYIDSYQVFMEAAKIKVIELLRRKIATFDDAYEKAKDIEMLILNNSGLVRMMDISPFDIGKMLSLYKKKGFIPENCETIEEIIRFESLNDLKEDYINQVLYNLTTHTNPIRMVNDKPQSNIDYLKTEIEKRSNKYKHLKLIK